MKNNLLYQEDMLMAPITKEELAKRPSRRGDEARRMMLAQQAKSKEDADLAYHKKMLELLNVIYDKTHKKFEKIIELKNYSHVADYLTDLCKTWNSGYTVQKVDQALALATIAMLPMASRGTFRFNLPKPQNDQFAIIRTPKAVPIIVQLSTSGEMTLDCDRTNPASTYACAKLITSLGVNQVIFLDKNAKSYQLKVSASAAALQSQIDATYTAESTPKTAPQEQAKPGPISSVAAVITFVEANLKPTTQVTLENAAQTAPSNAAFVEQIAKGLNALTLGEQNPLTPTPAIELTEKQGLVAPQPTPEDNAQLNDALEDLLRLARDLASEDIAPELDTATPTNGQQMAAETKTPDAAEPKTPDAAEANHNEPSLEPTNDSGSNGPGPSWTMRQPKNIPDQTSSKPENELDTADKAPTKQAQQTINKSEITITNISIIKQKTDDPVKSAAPKPFRTELRADNTDGK